MFDFLRKGATSVFAKIFLAVIIIVFIFWGIGSFVTSEKDLVAKVNGISITAKEFQEFYNFQLLRLKQTFGEISEEDLKKLNLKKEVLDELIKLKLLEDYANKIGVKVLPEEVSFSIAQIPSFQENGRFSPQKYQMVLRELGTTPKFFEKLVYYDILQQRLKLLLTTPIVVSDEEVKDYLRFAKQEIELLEGILPLKACIEKINYTEKDLENYYLAHRDIYKEEEKVKLAYIIIPYETSLEVTEAELKRFYEQNLDRFKRPFRAKIKTLLIEGTDDTSLKKAQKIKEETKHAKDLKVPAKWVEEGVLSEEIKTALKQSKEGQVLGPFKVFSGYLIIGVEAIKPEGIASFEEVREDIYKFLKTEKTRKVTQEKANKIYSEIMKENDLKIWAEKNKIKLLETNWLTKKDFLDQFQNPQLAKKVFESPKKEFFAPFETSKGFVILEIIDKKPARSLEFAEAKEKVKQDYLNSKGKELCEQKAKALLEKLKSKTDLIKEVFEKEGFQTKEYRLTRMEIPQKFSSNIAQLIANTGSSKVIDNIVWDRGDLKIFVIKSIKEFNGTIEDAEIQQASSVLLNQKRDKWFKEWYQNLFKKSKIKTYTLFEKF
ncbi:SurA N-terminal domain-containing protein [Thermodesulfobacterium sp.]|jgi:peptidyl-prolyl cis-trans isomerase D|uniref:SurA N-terminal domain-containing protein n=1 Tax=Thermodesulfobacterium sp. TaxID=1965289 RepID=UPI00257D2297|nr:SurA N-terminal domain-containing protein [Thermodesulfobacterium sp.]MBZ4681970.1 hypothetical protein [Thermodesulfobacterium sp.]MDK2861118.1 peptidyl-prolyl cis-trans isomerase [Thermodesulfobacterium sp.]MDN5379816.1 peptidyl-prolyl cis-trans isomerase [Thermodesulfobacterium sp.]